MSKEIFYRSALVDPSAIDEETRTVQLAFSSEAPYQRKFGTEVLSHKAEDVNMGFLQSGTAPLLFEHDPERQIGVIETAEISSDSVGRAKVRFSKSAFSQEIFQDVVDQIRSSISIGYVITEKSIEQRSDGQSIVRCKWTPKEISFVSIPADTSVGVGRSDSEVIIEEPATALEIKQESIMENQEINLDTVRSDAQKTERTRVAEISTLAQRHGFAEMATQYIADGRSVDEFRAAALEEMGRKQATVQSTAAIGLTEKEIGEFSLARAVSALASGDFADAGFEMEVSKEVAKQTGKVQTRSSIFLPLEFATRNAGANAVAIANNPALQDTRKVGFMDVLFNQTLASRLGVQFMAGLVGTVEFPKFTNAATARFVGEGVAGTIDKVDSDKVVMAPRTLIALTELTRSMVINSSGIESRLRAQLEKVMAQAMDKDVFAQVLADADIDWLTNPGTLAGYDFKALKAATKALALRNALNDNCRWAMDASIADLFETVEKDSNTVGIYLRGDDGRMAGFGSEHSENVGNNLIFGDWSEVTVGSWGTVEISVDTSNKFTSGGFLLRAITDVDTAVTRPESFTGYKAVI